MPAQSAIARIAAVVVAGGIIVAGISGCAMRDPEPVVPYPDPVTPTIAPPTTAPSIRPTVPPGGTALNISCKALLTAQAIYDFNPNLGIQAGFVPAAGTSPADAVKAGGVACNLFNQSSADTTTVAVAKPGKTVLADQKSRASAGSAVSGLGDAAYFAKRGDTRQIDVFRGDYWLVASSVTFAQGEDARPLITEALKHLP